MANENTMGAPTEGLGQTVTFSANGGGGVPQAQGSRRQSVRLNASGGGARLTAQALQVPETQPDATFAVLAKLGGELLKPHLEAERTAAYFSGMQKAAAGQAITDIVEEQPWYSKVFGSTSVVDGARAYTASAKASQMAVDLHTKMPEIRKMSGPEFAKYSTDMVAAAATGDNVTDMMFQQQAAKTLPEVMKTQATEHYRYQRELYYGAQEASVNGARQELSIADAEVRKAASGTDEGAKYMAQTKYIAAAAKFDQSIIRDPQMDKPTHDKILSREMQRGLMDKDFSMYNAMKGSGLIDKMEPELAAAVQRTFEYASGKARGTISDDLTAQLTNLTDREGNQSKTEAELLAGYREFNTKYTAETGDPSEFFGPAQTVQGVLQHRAERQQRFEAGLREDKVAARNAKTVADKEAAHVNTIETIANAIADPNGDISFGTVSTEELAEGWAKFHANAKSNDAVARAVVIQTARGRRYKGWGDSMNAGIAVAIDPAAADPSAMYRVYSKFYLPLVKASGQGEGVAQSYADPQYGPILQRYHDYLNNLPGEPDREQLTIAYHQALRKPVLEAQGPVAKMAEDYATSTTTGWLAGVSNALSITEDWVPLHSPEHFANVITPHVRPGIGSKDNAAFAKEVTRIKATKSTNLEEVGGYMIERVPGATPVLDWVNTAAGKAHDVSARTYHVPFDAAIAYNLEQNNLSDATVLQLGDYKGTPQFLISAKKPNGQVVNTYTDISSLLKSRPVAAPIPNPGSSLPTVGEDGTGWQGVLGQDALKKAKPAPTKPRGISGKVSQ